MLNRKLINRLILLKLNKSIVNDEGNFSKSQISKSLRIFYLGDHSSYVTMGEVKNGLKVQLSVGTVMYKVNYCNKRYEQHIDQLNFYPDLDTKL